MKFFGLLLSLQLIFSLVNIADARNGVYFQMSSTGQPPFLVNPEWEWNPDGNIFPGVPFPDGTQTHTQLNRST
jgi:hypothetical protein